MLQIICWNIIQYFFLIGLKISSSLLKKSKYTSSKYCKRLLLIRSRFSFALYCDSFVHRQSVCYFTHPLFVILRETCNYAFLIYYRTWMLQGLREHRWSGNYVTVWTSENLCFYSRQEQEITFFYEICRPAMLPAWPLIQWVPGNISPWT